MAKDSLGTVFIMFFGAVMILSYMIRIFERPFYRQLATDDVNYRQLDSYFNANYWMVITMTTVGYGDITPGTWMGRLIVIIACLTGSFIMAIFIG
jgi:voltage-gated potassium channel Kch